MSLCLTAPRRFGPRPLPSYPSLAVFGLVVATASCDGRSTRPAPDHVVQVSGVPAPVAAPAAPRASAGGELRFAEDDAELDLNVGCKGDCPSPYQMASARKDEGQVQARAEHCAREQGIERVAAILRGKVGPDGRAAELRFESVEGSLTDRMRECVIGLVSTAKLTPPEKKEGDRLMFARFHVPRVR